MSNVLPAAFITVATYALIALCKSVVPGFARLPNNALRAAGFVLCYAMLVVNALVAGAVHWADLWGLLPVAGALFSTAALMYHIGTDGPPAPATAPRVAPDVDRVSVDLSRPLRDPRQPAWAAALAQEAPPARAGTAQPAVDTVPPEPPQTPQTPIEPLVGPSVTYSSGPPTP